MTQIPSVGRCQQLSSTVWLRMGGMRDASLSGHVPQGYESEQLAALMDEVEKSLPPGWVRDRARENKLRADVFSDEACLLFCQGPGRPPPGRDSLSSRGR